MDTLNLDRKSKAELAEILSKETLALNNAHMPQNNGVVQEIQAGNCGTAGIFLRVISRDERRFEKKA
jgi:hypothetical protein